MHLAGGPGSGAWPAAPASCGEPLRMSSIAVPGPGQGTRAV